MQIIAPPASLVSNVTYANTHPLACTSSLIAVVRGPAQPLTNTELTALLSISWTSRTPPAIPFSPPPCHRHLRSLRTTSLQSPSKIPRSQRACLHITATNRAAPAPDPSTRGQSVPKLPKPASCSPAVAALFTTPLRSELRSTSPAPLRYQCSLPHSGL